MKNLSVPTRILVHRAALAAAAVISIFLLAVILIMLLQYRQLQRTRPLDLPALTALRERYNAAERGNEQLQEQIRQLDLLARRAWFTGQDQLRTGGLLVIGGLAVLLTALQIAAATRPLRNIPPGKTTGADRLAAQIRAGIAITGGVALLLAAISAFLFRPNIVTSPTAPATAKTPVSAEEFERNWPLFRGPSSIGLAPTRPLPRGWNAPSGQGVLWKSAIPLPGYSSPVVWNERVFVSGGNAQLREIYCFNAVNGELCWRHAADNIPGPPAMPPKVTEDTGYAAPTMAVDGQRAFAIFATGDLICADLNGRRQWAVNLGVPKNHYGYSSSPLLVDGKLIVQFFDEERQLLVALNADNGKPVWSARRQSSISWASPSVINIAGRKLIIVVTSDIVEAFGADNGQPVWQSNCMGGEVGASAAYATGRVLVANDNACAAAISAADGRLLWKNNELALPDVASPVAVDDLLFLFSGNGVVSAVDAATGGKLWEHELGVGFYSSPLLVDGRLLAFNLDGKAFIIKPDRKKYIQDATCELGEKVVATPALANGKLYVRTDKFLYCIGGTP